MKYIMHDWRVKNERYRYTKRYIKHYMWLASGFVAVNLLYWLVQ